MTNVGGIQSTYNSTYNGSFLLCISIQLKWRGIEGLCHVREVVNGPFRRILFFLSWMSVYWIPPPFMKYGQYYFHVMFAHHSWMKNACYLISACLQLVRLCPSSTCGRQCLTGRPEQPLQESGLCLGQCKQCRNFSCSGHSSVQILLTRDRTPGATLQIHNVGFAIIYWIILDIELQLFFFCY